MRLAVIGAGHIGSTIGRAWSAAGHDVAYGVPSPETHADLAEGGASVVAVSDAVKDAEAVLLAVPGAAVPDVLAATAATLDGRVVIDATNNVAGPGPLNAGAAVAQAAPGAAYYRAFNTLGWENFATPTFPGGERADLFYAGPDGASRAILETLVGDVGLHPVWVGGSEHVETVDGVARLWFALVMGRRMSRHTALRLLSD